MKRTELSELLRRGGLRPVYHGSHHHATLRELTRTWSSPGLVDTREIEEKEV